MTINLADNDPRAEYAVAQSVTQTSFAVPFEFFDDADLTVYVDGVTKTQGVDYTVSGGDGSTGTIAMSVTGATGGSQVVIVRNTALERVTDFLSGSDINRAALNEQLDTLTAMIADIKAKIDRVPTLPEYEVVNYTFTLPDAADRASKYLGFGPNGNLVTTAGTTSTIVASVYGEQLIGSSSAVDALINLGLTATAAEINVLDGITASTAELNILDGVTVTAADLNRSADATIVALAGYNTNGLLTQTAPDTFTGRTLTGTSNQITVTNGNGVSGNPTVAAVIASQAEAQAGTDNTKLMTALRVKESIIANANMALLGTINTTSGSSLSLTSLNLTSYRFVYAIFDGVGDGTTTSRDLSIEGAVVASTSTTAAARCYGTVVFDLFNGVGFALVTEASPSTPPQAIYEDNYRALRLATRTSSTTLTVALSGGSFAAGSVRFYGVK
jgi:hypothetical protein